MQLKDYYEVLELAPSATREEIRKAYRRLAQQYHPDKNGNDPYADAKFAVIKEAYETLTDPSRREFYLQQRWYIKSQGRFRGETIVTPVSVLKKLLELDKYSSRLDTYRTDFTSMAAFLEDIFSPETINTLNQFNEPGVNREIILATLKIVRRIPDGKGNAIREKLKKITGDADLHQQIDEQFLRRTKAAKWEHQKVWIAVCVVIAICVMIVLSTRS